MGNKIVAKNRKAKFEYFLLENYEAGISLKGSEIKSIRAGQISIAEAYVQITEEEAWLINAHIAPYDPASRENHDPLRKRRLLLHKNEIYEIWQAVRSKGLTVIPTEVYLSNGLAKLNIALAKGKKLYDKRQEIAKRDYQRDLDREGKR
ncbi:SsrA-binding protein SmpB [Pelolinea submarina]|jgi:SsrA-binding protein|uniref:SsrA-binding protein n=1 Tax=Pelolinea submarina TaxID=913107 RepID=A0A347ZT45_9CHLR|nr:SsrA-binding protein SmpB [Pelolinea submarina]REG10948.1 SsrA-binding protein [Pelolinea submarina]BBB48476.1 SsrA-binding protein [Pelolinea submarina]